MVQIQVHQGTYLNQDIWYFKDEVYLDVPTEKNPDGKKTPLNEIVMIEKATEQNVKEMDENWDLSEAQSEISASSNWGVTLGILGIIGESLYKGAKTTFIVKFKNGTKILATVHERYFNEIREMAIKNN